MTFWNPLTPKFKEPSETFDKTSGEQPRSTRPLLRPFIPAVVPLLVHVDDVVHLELQFVLAVGWIRRDAPEAFPYRLSSSFAGATDAPAVATVQRVRFSVLVHVGTGAFGRPVTQLLKNRRKNDERFVCDWDLERGCTKRKESSRVKRDDVTAVQKVFPVEF